MAPSLLHLLAGFVAALIAKTILQKWLAIKSIQKQLEVCPGGSPLWLHPFRTLALIMGPVFPLQGHIGYYYAAFSLFAKYGSTCISSFVFWGAIPTFWFCDADAIKSIQTRRAIFPKDVEAYETINIYGPNLIGSEGMDWKRHRAVANSAFNENNNSFVWTETIRVVHEWFAEIDRANVASDREASVDLLKDLTQVTLLVIASAGFGRRTSFKDDLNTKPPPGHKLAFRPAVTLTLRHVITKAVTPKWLYNLSDRIHIPFITPALNQCRDSFQALALHMSEVVSSARDWIASGKSTAMDAALLCNLVEANITHKEGGGSGRHLSDDELLSNTFTFLLAGHETSAHTLCFSIVLLALFPELQQRVYEEACDLWPSGIPSPSSPTPYKDSMANLEYTKAVFHETLRLFPPVARLAKNVVADTTVNARRFHSTPEGKISNVETYEVPVQAGSIVIIDILGLHNNPIHWGDDAAEFKPERFIDTDTYRWPRDAFNAFAAGPRVCIGQRFSTTESTCILAHIVRKYEIHVPDQFREKPWTEQKKIMLGWTPGITIIPTNARVTLRRRS